MCVALHTTILHVLIVHNRIVFLCLVHIKNTATSNSLLKTHIFIFYAHSKRKERHQSDLHLNRIVWFQSKQAYSNKMSIQSILCFDLIHSCYKLIVQLASTNFISFSCFWNWNSYIIFYQCLNRTKCNHLQSQGYTWESSWWMLLIYWYGIVACFCVF